MDKNYAIKLIQDVFQNPFNRDRFVAFSKNLFNFLDTEKNFVYRGNLIPDAYKSYIHTLERIGKYEDAEENKIDVLLVHLKKERSIEHARTMQRNFIAWYLAGSRGGELKDAALVAFHTDNPDDWRFSLVKMDYQIIESETGRIKTKTELTPARRFSFLVGENENSHTAQRQLLPILQDDTNNPLLSDFEKAFNIEVVTQEFFEKYKSLFLEVKESLERLIKKDQAITQDFVNKGVDPVDFSKKLLGQIVFLYFLQKKGWFGVARDEDWGTGPKDFLRRLFEKQLSDYDNFFNNILEPLFYEALAIERPDDFYSRFDCKIPFLNGGLFDPLGNYDWVHTDIRLPDELFSNDRKTREGDIGDGILDIFDRYNFTVKEDEPLEKEVAVDPEMLGKVFENLLEVKDRKSKGTYYTPREIVHYMCQESLINYLVNECEGKINREDIKTLIQYGESAVEHDSRVEQEGKETETYSYKLPESIRKNAQLIDDKLKNIRVCDPAIGSGAFPVGMMNEIIRTRNALTSYLEDKEDRSIYNFKRDAIQNSLYGVDIDPGAVEIAKLRLWLSLVVDEEDIKQIKPLPNLDYKIMQGNSLLEEFEGVRLFDDRLLNSYIPINDDQIKKLETREKEIQKNLMIYYQRNPLWMKNQKIERPAELYQLEGELKRVQLAIKDEKGVRFQIKDSNQNALFGDEQKARKIWEELQSLQKEFFETAQKREKDELKKQVEQLEWELIEATLREENKESSLKKLELYKRTNIKPFFLWKLHFSEVFQEKGGFDVVIANPPYIGEKGHKEIFKEIKQSNLGRFYIGKMDIFYFFFHLALDLVHKNSQIGFITTNYYPTADGAKKLRQDFRDRTAIRNLINLNELKIFKSAMGQHNMITILSKTSDKSIEAMNCITKKTGIATQDDLQSILSWQDKETEYFSVSQGDLFDGEENYIRLYGMKVSTSHGIQAILEKMKRGNFKLESYCNINIGMRTGADKVTPEYIRLYNLKDNNKDGIFVITKAEKDELNLNNFENTLLLPFYKNSDIQRYRCKTENDLYLIDLSYPKNKNLDFHSVPNILRHIKRYESILKNRRSNDNGLQAVIRSGYWWSYTMRQLDFSKPKIISPQRSKLNTFAYNSIPWYASMDVYFITEKDKSISLKYILALINSKLYYSWLYHRGKRKGDNLELYQKPLSEIPIKRISSDEQKPFVEIVDKILAITNSKDYLSNSEKQAKVKDYEKQIDQLVYKLYDLTPEEIIVVEGK